MKTLLQCLCGFYIFLIFAVPTLCSVLPILLLQNIYMQSVWILLTPFVYTLSFILTAGLLSLPHQKGIIEGTFPRDIMHPIYRHRKLYGLCWTSVYYFKPIYFICLNTPILKTILFRLFGYRGSLDICLFPDTWIRDLPLLDIEEGVYISNKATLGTNLSLLSGDTVVKKITLRKNVLIGHLYMIGGGCSIDENTEIGPGAVLGLEIKIGKHCRISHARINHFSILEDKVKLGADCSLGPRVFIAKNINISPGKIIRSRSKILTQEQADHLPELTDLH